MIRSFSIEIKRNHPIWERIDYLSLQSKYLYNSMLYEYNKYAKENDGFYPNSIIGRKLCQNRPEWYKLENTKCSNRLWNHVFCKNIKSYLKSLSEYKKNKLKFKSVPKRPNYLSGKEKGRFLIVYDIENVSHPKLLKQNILKFCNIDCEFKLPYWFESKTFKNCVIKPNLDGSYKIIVNYQIEDKQELETKNFISIDLGINNLATITFSDFNRRPIIINGKPLKSINQFYNKKLAKLQKQSKIVNNKFTNKKIRKLTNKRNKKINNYLHQCSKIISSIAKETNSSIVIGKNEGWKNKTNLGKKNNQKFVQIPFNRLIEQITYKSNNYGIKTYLQEESYTSKSSFIDFDEIPTYKESNNVTYAFSGKRIKRGLYESKSKFRINADVNGSLNILKKSNLKTFTCDEIEGVVAHPMILIPNIIYLEKS